METLRAWFESNPPHAPELAQWCERSAAEDPERWNQPMGFVGWLRFGEKTTLFGLGEGDAASFVAWANETRDAVFGAWLAALGDRRAECAVAAAVMGVAVAAWRRTIEDAADHELEALNACVHGLRQASKALEEPATDGLNEVIRRFKEIPTKGPPPPYVGHLYGAVGHLLRGCSARSEDRWLERRRHFVEGLTFARCGVDGVSLDDRIGRRIPDALGSWALERARGGEWGAGAGALVATSPLVHDPLERSDLCHRLAAIYRDAGALERAETYARLSVSAEAECDRPARLGNHRLFLAGLLADRGARDEALALARAGLEDYLDAYGADHSETRYVQSVIARLSRL